MDALLPPGGITLRDALDVLVVALLLWAVIAGLRRARARLALGGFLVVGLAWLIAVTAELELTQSVLQALALVLLVVFVVVFQDDLRRLFERTALALRRRPGARTEEGPLDVLVRACERMAATRVGALVVIPGREPLDAHLDGGIELDAKISEPLLLSLFDPHSPGHDGAALLAGGRVVRFALHLPLSTEHAGEGGTRHAAALGLAERSDATCVVVSEERGTISVAHDGRLEALGRDEQAGTRLRARLAELFAAAHPRRSLASRLALRAPELLVALAFAAGLWLLFVPGSVPVRDVRTAGIELSSIPEGWAVDAVSPPTVEVTLTGARRDFLTLPSELDARIRAPEAALLEQGRRTVRLEPADLLLPERITVESITPDAVRLTARAVPLEPDEEEAAGDAGDEPGPP